MRSVTLIFLTAAALTGAGIAVCTALHWDPHPRELLLAGAVCFAASVLALVPAWLMRGASQAAVVQAALMGTVIHLIASLVLGAGVVATGIVAPKAFLLGVLTQYWATLIVLSIELILMIRKAPIAATGAGTHKS